MHNWITEIIGEHKNHEKQSLEGFASYLKTALDCSMNGFEKKIPTLIHIAGYAMGVNSFHPEFHSVSNAEIDSATGEYSTVSDTFRLSEDFWSRDCKFKDSHTGFSLDPEVYSHQIYVNGYPLGRMAYMTARHYLQIFFETVWRALGFAIPSPKLTRRIDSVMSHVHEYNSLFI